MGPLAKRLSIVTIGQAVRVAAISDVGGAKLYIFFGWGYRGYLQTIGRNSLTRGLDRYFRLWLSKPA